MRRPELLREYLLNHLSLARHRIGLTASLLATERQQRTVRGIPLAAG